MKKRISDLMDHIHDADYELNQETPLSSQRIKELTMSKITNNRNKRHAGYRVLVVAAIIAALTATAFAAGNLGWFRQYFEKQTDVPLTSEQIQFIEENEQVISETQSHNGYSLELKSILADNNTIYAIVGITAPSDVTEEDLRSLWGSDINVYDESGTPIGSWGVKLHIGADGATDLMFELNTADWNSGSRYTLHIASLGKLVHDEVYEQELLDTKYAGQENIMFTDEEAAKIYQQVILAEGPWEFTIDLNEVERESIELIAEPVMLETCIGFKEDGTDVFDEVKVTSFILSPLGATIYADCDYAPDFTAGQRKIFAVMTDGSQIELMPDWGRVGEDYLKAASPIILDEVDHILLADGTKIDMP